jgi:DNA polymerase-3 subunit gamma/tau
MLLRMAASRGKQPPDTPYQVVARRFRPVTFEEVVGQDEVLLSLRRALQQKTVPHAFLFSGSRGVGKTTSARILARCLNCEKGPTPEPCGKCASCTSILDGSNPDVIEIDAASNNSVEDVRELREHAGYATMRSRYRVFILDEAHMMSKSAFNAFLKTLEEPPPHVVFVLATTEINKVPDTIRSRCQVLLFRRVGETDLQKRLRMIAEREGVKIPAEVLAEIAASVNGGVRDAETALERVLPLARDLGPKFDLAAWRSLDARVGLDATIAVVAALLQGDARAGLHFAREQQQQGTDEREALGEIVAVLRWLLLLKVDGPDSDLVPAALRERLGALAAAVNPHQLDAMVAAGLLGRERLRRLEDRSVVFEVALVRMAQAGSLQSLADLLAEVRAGGGATAPVAAAPAQRPMFGTGAARPPASGAGPTGTSAEARPPAPVPPTQQSAQQSTPMAATASDLRSRAGALLTSAMLKDTLEQCRLEGPNAQGLVVLTLHSDRKMHRDRLASPVIQEELRKAIQQAAGAPVKLDFRLGEAAAPPRDATPPKEPGPVTKRVIEKFHGRIVEVNPPDRVQQAPPADDDGAPIDEQPPNLQE